MKKKITKPHARKQVVRKKKSAKKRAVLKKVAVKTKALARNKKRTGAKTPATPEKRARRRTRSVETEPFALERPGARSGGQSGDLQGLSDVEGADSESVDELLEEGNAFEADVVAGVERADEDEKPVRTHEVPEDDVPGEYLDEEQ